MKKRIGNDIHFVWHIYRKSGETQTPESFDGKDVEVKLISPLRQPVTIEDVSIATGVVTFTFRGKHQVTLGNYVAVLLENKGEDGMVTIDVVSAVSLVPHSYMEEDGDEGDVIETESVELTSTISAGGGGGFVQQQSDWAQTDDTAVDFIKHKPNLDVFARLDSNNVHTAGYDRYRHEYEQVDTETTIQGDGISSYNYNKDGSLRAMTNFIPGSITLIKDGVTLNLSYRYFANLIASIQAKADVADLASLVNTGTYNSTSKKIELKHDNNVLAEIDATAFIKDGMVSSVTISNGYLVITFNTDAGKEPISIALTDIFNPANYYDKDDVDGLLAGKVDKETGKGLSTNDYTTAEKTKLGALPTNEELTQALGGKANTSDLAEVATTGSYNDLSDKPTIPDITGKADKVSNATNGNFAALDGNGNLTDSGHKHSDYLTQHQDLSNYVQKSQTAGLLKNDGTVDTNTYLTQHQDISGKADKSEMSVVPGTGADADKTTITLKQGTSAMVLTTHQDISIKENVMPIEAVASGTTAITAEVNKYYEVAGTVSSLTVTLPTPTVNTEVTMVVVHLTVGASPTVVVTSVNEVVKFSAAYSVVANKEYELSCLYNGSKWIVSSMEVAV